MTDAKRAGRINVWPDSTVARSVADADNVAFGVMTVASTSAAARAHQHHHGGGSGGAAITTSSGHTVKTSSGNQVTAG